MCLKKIPILSLFILTVFSSCLMAEEKDPGYPIQLLPHKGTWFLASHAIEAEESPYYPEENSNEMKIQVSLKIPLQGDFVFLGYTQKAFYQVWDKKHSRPFRELNYNPEFFMQWDNLAGMKWLRLGIWEHESNGERFRYAADGTVLNYSRTWNRIYLFPTVSLNDHFDIGLKLWEITDRYMDKDEISYYQDNPDLADYMGNAELYLNWEGSWGKSSYMFRRGYQNGTETWQWDHRVSFFQMGLSESWKNTFLHLQWFQGYGESLIDYNRKVNKLALGISFK